MKLLHFKYKLLVSFLFLLLSSCEGKITSDTSSLEPDDGETTENNVLPCFERFNITLNDGTVVEGQIDNENKMIILPGINNPSMISDVEYSLFPQNAKIQPEPVSRLDKWDAVEIFKIFTYEDVLSYRIVLQDYDKPADAMIYINQNFGRETKYFFYDLKGGESTLHDINKAQRLFGTNGMNGLRISIYGDEYYGGHPEPGVVELASYSNMLKSMRNAKDSFSGDKFFIFASKKNMGRSHFPDWANNPDGTVDPEKYIILLQDYIKFMKEQGFEIDVLGIDNEYTYNSGKITVDKYKTIVLAIKAFCKENGYKVPLFVAHEFYMPQGDVPNSWLKEAQTKDVFQYIDIYGTHYYPQHHFQVQQGRFEALKYEFNLMNSDRHREFWATEPHWDDGNSNDKFYYTEQALCAMFDQTDLGMDAFMWWGYTDGNSVKGQIMQAFSLGIFKSTPIRVIDHDGESTFTKGDLQTRAYIRGDEVNMFIINMTAETDVNKNYEGYKFKLSDALNNDEVSQTIPNTEIVSPVNIRQWTDNSGYSGIVTIKETDDKYSFSMNIPSRSVSHVVFKIK